MKKKFVCLALGAMMALSMTACSGGSNQSAAANGNGGATNQDTPVADTSNTDTIEVGVVLPTKDEPRWIQDQGKFEEILGQSGVTNQVLFSQGSSATEKSNVETLIAKGIKVLIICAQDASAASAAVEEAKAAGVTVIAYDRLITGTDAVDYYVTFDSVAVGEAMGQFLTDKATGTGNPLYLYAGAATDNNAFLFFEGAWNILQPKIADGTFIIKNSSEAEKLKDLPTLTRDQEAAIIGQVTTDWDFNVAKSKAEAHLTALSAEDKGEVFVLAPNDGTSRSIADVFATDPDVSNYFITGQDSEIASIQYIIDGKQSMTVFKDTRTLASDSVEMAKAILNGETIETDASYNNGNVDVPSKQTPVVVVTKDNVNEALIDSGYYEASQFTGLN